MAYASLKKILDQQLAEIRAAGLYKHERQILSPQGADIRVAQGAVLNLCANNYLGLANHPDIRQAAVTGLTDHGYGCLLYTSPSPRDRTRSRMPSSA